MLNKQSQMELQDILDQYQYSDWIDFNKDRLKYIFGVQTKELINYNRKKRIKRIIQSNNDKFIIRILLLVTCEPFNGF